MVPIPNYLRGIAVLESFDKEIVSFSIKCNCGNDYFSVQENFYTKSELEQIKPWVDAMTNSLSGYGSYCTKDSDGKLHHWKKLSTDGSKVEEVFIPEEPPFGDTSIIKLICPECKSEHIIFDSRKNGYDGVNSGTDENRDNSYQPHFRNKCRSLMKITIKIENFPSVEEFNTEHGLYYTEEEYSNSFSWMVIYGTNTQGKKRKLDEFETA